MPSKSLKNSVSLSKDSLILSLPEANEPVVWRMDLKQAQAASFTVKEDSGTHALIKMSNEGEEKIATFESKDEAMGILMDVSSALQGGKSANTNTHSQAPQRGELVKWGIALGGVLIVVTLFFYLASISPEGADPFSGTSASAEGGPASPDATGVPVSADAFLSGQ